MSLERVTTPSFPATAGRPLTLSRRTSRTLAGVEEGTLIQLAGVQAEGMVQAEKLRELDRLGAVAMDGQALLRRHAAVLAVDDPFLADDLRFFTDMIKLGKGEIIADTIRDFAR